MKKQVDKSKITIVIMSIVFALSLSVTITLAAFSANKTGDVTLTFADGLTLTLSPQGSNNSIQITGGEADSYTFSYPAQVNAAERRVFDGVLGTLNKSAWVSYQVALYETTSGSSVAPSGKFELRGNTYYFVASGTKSNWMMPLALTDDIFSVNLTGVTNIITFMGAAQWGQGNVELTNRIIYPWSFRHSNLSLAGYMDDLAGRSFEIRFTIKARTDSAPTF